MRPRSRWYRCSPSLIALSPGTPSRWFAAASRHGPDHDDEDAVAVTGTADHGRDALVGLQAGRDLHHGASLQPHLEPHGLSGHALRADLEGALTRDRPALNSADRRLTAVLMQDLVLLVAEDLLELRQ